MLLGCSGSRLSDFSSEGEFMSVKISHSRSMFLLLAILTFVYYFGQGIYALLGLEAPTVFEILYLSAFLSGTVWWMRAATRGQGFSALYCPGVMVQSGWLIVVPYYLFKTRGLRGLLPLLVLIGIFLVAQILVIVIYMAYFLRDG
jgi:hypothetical protein